MDIQEFDTLLSEMPIEETRKAQAKQLFQEGKTAEALRIVNETLAESIDRLSKEDPEAAAEYKAAKKEYQDSLAAAEEEFNATMTEIEADAQKLESDTVKQLEEIHMAEVQESIQSS